MQHKNNVLCKRSLAAITVLLLLCAISTVPAQTVPQIAEKALAATVYLEMQDSNGKALGFGSGFFVRQNLIVTNYHVIAGAARGIAKLVGTSTKYAIEGVTATDQKNDLAILKVTAYGIKPLLLGDSNAIRIGEAVYVAGNPKGLEGTFSDGIISSRRDKSGKERLQMTAPISPGSSGGPVLNRKGEVIGVSVSIYRALDAQNLNFAIPSKYVKALFSPAVTAKPLGQNNAFISADTYFRRGYAKEEIGDYRGAIADYTEAIRLKPDFAYAYGNRGAVKSKLGQHFAAITDYDIAIRLKPNFAQAYNNRGLTKDKLEQYAAAVADYNTAIRLESNFALAYNNRGLAKDKLGQYAAAITDYDIAIRLKPNFAPTYYNRGSTKNELGQYAAAIADYNTAIRLKADFTEAYMNRGAVKSKLGQHFAAITDYDTVIHLKPDYANAYYSRGITKGLLKQHDAAIVDYSTAIRLKTDFAEAYFCRGMAKHLLGVTWEAKQDFLIALRLAEKAGDAHLKSEIEETLQKIR